ncbi:hypothetical protein G8759_19875 [Spirosoma aureum]|uniref:Uncharacterized protein n=1 Tax=Spirosoma aureum TaxID=2692134 RepID=A0A6G9AQM7_9BACT|nr:hypothetical protein [Spirosoma aureum]QIP14710.1 hypothetical protein G8759_19875 [Spirosoma aureum]
MDHRIFNLGEKVILLDRMEEEDGRWQVMISTYVTIQYRFDEWAYFDQPEMARQFIVDYSEHAAMQFLEFAKERWQLICARQRIMQPYPALNAN